MEYFLYFETWIILALLLSCLEVFISGGILLNLGIAALLVAIGLQQLWLTTWIAALVCWFICAAFLLSILYLLVKNLLLDQQISDKIHQKLISYNKKDKNIILPK